MTTAVTVEEETNEGDGGQQAGTRERSLSLDVVFHVLQNERRRRILEYLATVEGPVRMGDLAEQVAAREYETTVEQLSSKQRQRVYIPLYQNHLPKLDEEGIIDYNQSRGVVKRKPLADQFTPYLNIHAERDGDDSESVTTDGESVTRVDPLGRYYLGVSALGTALLVAKWLELGPVSMLPEFFVGVGILLAFSLLSLARIAVADVRG